MADNKTTQSDGSFEELAKPLSARFKWVRGFFYAIAVGMAIMLLGTILVFFTDFTGYNPDVDFNTSDIITSVGALIYLPAFLGAIITFCLFIYRAMKNLHIWRSRSVEMSAGWAVGWNFVPVANLWKPFQAMDQIWDGTHDVTGGKIVPNAKIGLWWMCWIAMNFTSGVSTALAGMDGPWNSVMRQAAVVEVISLVSGILAVLLIVPTLKTIAARQDGKIKSFTFA